MIILVLKLQVVKESPMALSSNIILLTIDCLRYDCLTPILMPNVFKLAQEGIIYTNAYSEFGHTMPSFQTLFESEWIYELKRREYYTIGINYNAYLAKGSGYELGFDFWHDLLSHKGPPSFIDDSKELHEILFNHLNQNGITEPFFIWIHYMDCHAPYYPHKWTRLMRLADCGAPLVEITPEVIAQLRSYYNDAVIYMDKNLGELFDYFDDTTKFIISADHGEEFFEHGRFGHDAMRTNEEVLHIPLIVKGQGRGINDKKILFRDLGTIILNI